VALGGGNVLSQPNATQAMTAIEALNVAAGSRCVSFGTAALPLAPPAPSYVRQMQALIKAMQSGRVGALLILGQANPAFSLPPAFGFAQALARVPFVAALTPMEDDTTAFANVLLPTRTFMEDWGDDIPDVVPAGTTVASLRQPIIDPQFITDSPGLSPEEYAHDLVPWMDTRGLGDLLLDIARRQGTPLADADTRAAVRRTWAGLKQANLAATGTDNDPAWIAALGKGGFWKQAAIVPAAGRLPTPAAVPAAAPVPMGAYALHLFPQTYQWDGRHANLGWAQEIADPMTMAVWNSWVEINLQEAMRLGIRTGDIVRITGPQGSVEAPAIPTPGLHPQVIAMPIGQGHGDMGRNASGRGTNPLAILAATVDAQTGSLAYGAAQVRIEKVKSAQSGYNGKETLVLIQDRPGGAEPDAVKDLIHTTAKEWKQAKPVTGAPQAEGSIFHRGGAVKNQGYNDPGGD
jgi:anaerobic selenocysteine-containing dehydrogenase